MRTAAGATTSTTLADLETSVTNAEAHGGGWVMLVFHGICDDQCTAVDSVTTETFGQFLDWLAPRAVHGTVQRRTERPQRPVALGQAVSVASARVIAPHHRSAAGR